MFKLLKKPQCQKLSKFSGYRPTDKPTPRSSDPELKNLHTCNLGEVMTASIYISINLGYHNESGKQSILM